MLAARSVSASSSSSLLSESASSLARRIAAGELSSVEVVEAHIDRISTTQQQLNALVHDRYDEARRDAALADRVLRERGAAQVGPLHGVPVTVKECLGLRGLRKTAGLVARREVIADEDATCAARLRAAGAIPLGVSNVSELMMWMETSNKVYGQTNNPYALDRTAGGSSGGEGALVGAGASPIGIGSDVGGSIRMPAFFNGVFGHKPSAGLIPNTGHWPMSENAAARYLGTGPLCRRAEDLWPTLRLLAGPDGIDAGCTAMPLGDPAKVSLAGLTIYDVPSGGVFQIDPELQEAQRKAADHLASLGARVIPFSHPDLKEALLIWSTFMSDAADTSFSTLLGGGTEVALGGAFYRLLRGTSPHTFPALGLALLERLVPLVPGHDRAIAAGRRLKADLDALLDERAVLLYPSYPELAPRHGHAIIVPLKWQYTAIWNVLEVPVTQVPLGLSREGLPLGVQVVAGHGRDHVSVAVAQELERGFGGWVPPTL